MSFQIHHGDCLEVMRQMPKRSVDAVVTDPPYGISYSSGWTGRRAGANARRRPAQCVPGDDRLPVAWVEEAARLAPVVLAFCEWRHSERLRVALVEAGLRLRGQLVWDRGAHGMGDLRRGVAPSHDLAWLASTNEWQWPGARLKSVLRHSCGSSATRAQEHPTQKPVELMCEIVEALVPDGSLVLDPHMGSGSTGVAAIRSGRRFHGIEIDGTYFSVAQSRLAAADNGALPRQGQPSLFGGARK